MNLVIFLKIWIIKLFYPRYWHMPTALIYAQSSVETGNFTSAIYKENHNLFGMREAKTRDNTAIGTNRAHAKYKSDIDSIKDFFLRQKYFNLKYTTREKYYNFLESSNYAEAKNYTKVIEQVYKRINFIYYYLPFVITPTLFFIVLYFVNSSFKNEVDKFWNLLIS